MVIETEVNRCRLFDVTEENAVYMRGIYFKRKDFSLAEPGLFITYVYYRDISYPYNKKDIVNVRSVLISHIKRNLDSSLWPL